MLPHMDNKDDKQSKQQLNLLMKQIIQIVVMTQLNFILYVDDGQTPRNAITAMDKANKMKIMDKYDLSQVQ